MNKEMLKGTIDILILSVLSNGDNYGYGISKKIKTRSEDAFEILEATLYLALKRLEKQGAIRSYWGNETGGGRRKYFTMTDQGRSHLASLTADWRETSGIVNRFV